MRNIITRRFMAAIIDHAIVYSIIFVPRTLLMNQLDFPPNSFYLITALAVLIMIFRDIFGRSIGKIIFGLKIVNSVGKNAAPLWKRICRNLLLVVAVVDIITILVRKDHRKFLDVKLGTEVIEKTGDG